MKKTRSLVLFGLFGAIGSGCSDDGGASTQEGDAGAAAVEEGGGGAGDPGGFAEGGSSGSPSLGGKANTGGASGGSRNVGGRDEPGSGGQSTANGGTPEGGRLEGAGGTSNAGEGSGGQPNSGGTAGSEAGGAEAILFATEFTDLEGFYESARNPGGGSIDIVFDSSVLDGAALGLVFPGDPGLGSSDRTSPDYAIEVGTDESFLYGRFETSVRFPSCGADEEVVTGIFTYFNDGSDGDNDGIADNSEIDIEHLCGEPQILWLTVWTDYEASPTERFYKHSRAIDLTDGSYLETGEGEESIYDISQTGTIPGLVLADFPNPDTFYRVGFEWRESLVRYYIVLEGSEVELYRLEDPNAVPARAASFLCNLWHAPTHWMKGGDADYPAADARLLVDWLRISE